MIYHRRSVLGFGAAAGLLALPGCSSLPGMSLTEAVKRLLTVSSQNAFAQLLQPNGFFDSQVARLSVPDSLGGSRVTNIASALLRSKPIQDRLLRQVNRAAENGAELAAPIVAETIRNMSISDALAIVNGGPRAATSLLQGQLGNTLVERMLPGVGSGLRLFDNEIINLVLSQATNIDFASISRDVTNKVNDAIYRSIGAQEESIRANPRATNDPLLIAVLGAGRAF
ncbi:MAG: DUF4197 domain-containing protein [Sphingomonadales bacterium]|nr:DUF4197 domain-containing protein [Sphingomonadales bacterium]PIX67196.1 MAG: DUF4197 domain-containing protein [Sphingomonadales bacterium CG_4_10_14_3_um_filter_58_15]NCO47857.1 DUF4197 domain-containing protein [Sphingomonadales bacterium]NCO98849.1 DUF4197 domain-containing protein [Sphingomonadales bacterium]NCP28342.1 DUF4197 domain-containing protein [Sphingomonadales bacterium]